MRTLMNSNSFSAGQRRFSAWRNSSPRSPALFSETDSFSADTGAFQCGGLLFPAGHQRFSA
jgi:hypothetical protein